MDIKEKTEDLRNELPGGVELVAVSKTYPPESIMEAYDAGQRMFGENRPQEMRAKYEVLPKDIRWHMIGHLQTNKVKYIAPYVELIHSVDSERLLETIEKEAVKNNRTIDVLLELRIADEETKHGWEEEVLEEFLLNGGAEKFSHIRFRGLMGIATYTEDREQLRAEFSRLAAVHARLAETYFGKEFDILSMGMTSDYDIAIECGSNMVRIGSLIFGSRNYD